MFTYDHNHSGLRFGVTFEHTAAVLTLCGELDVASVDFLESVLVSVRDAGVEQVRIDASGVTFADCSTLSVLHRQRDHYAQCGRQLVVAVPGDALTRLAELVGDRSILGGPEREQRRGRAGRRGAIGSWSGHISRMATKRQTIEPHAGDKR